MAQTSMFGRIINFLSQTSVGRGIVAFWDDLPLWVGLNTILVVVSAPCVFVMWRGWGVGALVLTAFPIIVLWSIANITRETIDGKVANLRHAFDGNVLVALALWAATMLIGGLFMVAGSFMVIVLACVITVVIALFVPHLLGLPATYTAKFGAALRNALVMAVHYPVTSLGLAVFAALLAWLSVWTRGSLLVVAPTLWLLIAAHCTHELTQEIIQHQ